MKTTNSIKMMAIAALLGAQVYGTLAKAVNDVPPAKEVIVGLNDVYVPAGFDSEADAYVVVNGIFPNGCYRWKGAEVDHKDSFNHEIRSKAMVSQGLCLMVLMPFQKEVRLGQLESGTHQLRFVNGDGTYLEKTMKVE
jgi:hypothetical protein